LDHIAESLLISKASASTGSRYLLALHAIRQVWIPGERRDFFEARGELGEVLRAAYANLIVVKLEKSERKLKEFVTSLEEEHSRGEITGEDYSVCRNRFRQFEKIQGKLKLLLPMLEKLL
jgi:DNA-binding transcriptional regulator GbsR (MarR family)